MTDYNRYTAEAGITNREMIEELHRYFPRYGKPTQTMVCHPEKYGVQLTPQAEAIIVRRFGDYPGLSEGWDFANIDDLVMKKRRPERRRKGNKLTVRLDDSLFSELRALYDRTAFASMQDMVEAAIVEFLNKRHI